MLPPSSAKTSCCADVHTAPRLPCRQAERTNTPAGRLITSHFYAKGGFHARRLDLSSPSEALQNPFGVPLGPGCVFPQGRRRPVGCTLCAAAEFPRRTETDLPFDAQGRCSGILHRSAEPVWCGISCAFALLMGAPRLRRGRDLFCWQRRAPLLSADQRCRRACHRTGLTRRNLSDLSGPFLPPGATGAEGYDWKPLRMKTGTN